MIEILKPDFCFEDNRGKLLQLIHNDCKQVNYVESSAGVTRGGHYHKRNKEIFYVIEGEFDVTVTYSGESETKTFRDGDFFAIDKGLFHSFYYKKDTKLIVAYSIGVELENGEKDIYAE